MRRTKEEAERTRKELMAAGVQVFGRKGYAATRLSEIASEAGVTRGAVYWHFGSKKGLMFAILREMANPYIQIATEVLGSDMEPVHKIRETICRVMDAMERRGAPIYHEQLALRFKAEHPEEFLEYHGDASWGMRKVTGLLKRTIREGQKARQIRRDANPSTVAGVIAAVLRGSSILKSVPNMNLLPRGSSEAVADLIMKGLEPR